MKQNLQAHDWASLKAEENIALLPDIEHEAYQGELIHKYAIQIPLDALEVRRQGSQDLNPPVPYSDLKGDRQQDPSLNRLLLKLNWWGAFVPAGAVPRPVEKTNIAVTLAALKSAFADYNAGDDDALRVLAQKLWSGLNFDAWVSRWPINNL